MAGIKKNSTGESTSVTSPPSTQNLDDVVGFPLRAAQHIKENNIAYLVGTFILYQLEIFHLLFTYGQGVCTP